MTSSSLYLLKNFKKLKIFSHSGRYVYCLGATFQQPEVVYQSDILAGLRGLLLLTSKVMSSLSLTTGPSSYCIGTSQTQRWGSQILSAPGSKSCVLLPCFFIAWLECIKFCKRSTSCFTRLYSSNLVSFMFWNVHIPSTY